MIHVCLSLFAGRFWAGSRVRERFDDRFSRADLHRFRNFGWPPTSAHPTGPVFGTPSGKVRRSTIAQTYSMGKFLSVFRYPLNIVKKYVNDV